MEVYLIDDVPEAVSTAGVKFKSQKCKRRRKKEIQIRIKIYKEIFIKCKKQNVL